MSKADVPWISLSSGELSAEVDPQGAQLSTLRDREGLDLLWNGDAAVWAGRAPLLFPIVGALAGGRYRIGARSYALSRHGFARGSRFETLESSATRALFRLDSNPERLELFPFNFALDVDFTISEATLTVTTSVCNRGDEPMPASFGYHPALRWPLPYGRPRAEHDIEFAEDEPAPVRRLDGAGLLTPVAHPTPVVDRRLVLEDSLFRDDVVIFDQIRSRRLSYGAASGPRIEMSYPDSPYLGIWTKPGAPFICIEPWHGVADPQGFAGDFTAKPGVFIVAPGGALAATMAITLRR